MSDAEPNTRCKCGDWCNEHRDIICGFNEERDALKAEVEYALGASKAMLMTADLQIKETDRWKAIAGELAEAARTIVGHDTSGIWGISPLIEALGAYDALSKEKQ